MYGGSLPAISPVSASSRRIDLRWEENYSLSVSLSRFSHKTNFAPSSTGSSKKKQACLKFHPLLLPTDLAADAQSISPNGTFLTELGSVCFCTTLLSAALRNANYALLLK